MILSDTARIRDAIGKVLARDAGRRVALVAFIGRDVERFVPHPKGIDFYCWDNPIATNPDGLYYLYRNGANIYFAQNLHMKVFWSEGEGLIVGSANLSTNALGGGTAGLFEAVYFTRESSRIDIDKLIKQVVGKNAPRKVTSADLAAFQKRYDAASTNRVGSLSESRPKSLSFPEYIATGALRPFKVALWTQYDESEQSDRVRKAISGRVGISEDAVENHVKDSVYDQAKVFRPGDWVLELKLVDDRVTAIHWLLADVVVAEGKSHTLVELKGTRRSPPPFSLDHKARLKRAISAAWAKSKDAFEKGALSRATLNKLFAAYDAPRNSARAKR